MIQFSKIGAWILMIGLTFGMALTLYFEVTHQVDQVPIGLYIACGGMIDGGLLAGLERGFS